jgi:basic membrane protein A and related proteins
VVARWDEEFSGREKGGRTRIQLVGGEVMKRVLALIGAASLLSAAIVTPVAATGLTSHAQAKSFKVGVVLDVGGVNDKSFNHLAYLGMQEAVASYRITGRYVVSTGSSQYVPNLTQFAAAHYNLVIMVGFLAQSAIYQVAKQYPHVKFAMVDGAPQGPNGATVNLPNVANLFFKEQESGYLVGVIAGEMEKLHIGKAQHGTIGYMGGVSIPPVNRYIAGYIEGARKIMPSIKVLSGYSQSFTDQNKGREIGLAQISQGADILFQVAGASGLGYLSAAQQQARYGIGVDANQSYLGKYIMTSAIKKVDVAVKLTIHQALTGHFRGGDHHFSLLNSATGFAKPAKYVPKAIVAIAKLYEQKIRSGKIVPSPNIP